MKKRITALILCAVTVFAFAGCKKKSLDDISSTGPVPVSEPVNRMKINPFTGMQDLDPAYENRRPVAVMINNISTAQPVQTGVNHADIVYETEVEGGVTRLMAVFKNIETVGQLGPVRSARYPYIDLAMGHDAVYFHCGQDPTYAAPHLRDTDHVSVETDKYAKRISNGLAWEHTLYTFGSSALEAVENTASRSTTDRKGTWLSFAKEDETVSFENSVANSITVPFNYSAGFTYNATTGLYTRSTGGTVRTDYVTGETTDVKNVFILNTTIVNYPDGYHRQVYLDGGSGYYAVNGTYTQIRWSKGGASEGIKITDANGAEIKINVGKSWVFIVNESTTVPTFQ